MKRAVVIVLLSFVYLTSYGQDWAKVPTTTTPKIEESLKAGDKMPFAELHNMINYPKKTLKFLDHKPKLILLDFWATYCGPCVKSWPETLKLQKEFGDDLQIILVNTHENVKQVERFLERRNRIDGFYMDMPMSCRDSAIWKAFPTAVLPRYAWIGEDGVIGSLTGGEEVTRENVKRWINSGPFKMNQIDQKKYYDVFAADPIFVNGNGGEKPSDVFLYSSSITKGQSDNYSGGMAFHHPDVGYGITITNDPIIALYGYAYSSRTEFQIFDFLPLSRIQLIAKDTSKYYWDGTLSGNAYNYQLLTDRPATRKELFVMMRNDLERYFGLRAKWEKQVKKCLVLSMFDSTLLTKSKSLGSESKMREFDFILDSTAVRSITTLMESGSYYYRRARYPIIDDTGYRGRVTGIREKVKSYDPATLDKIFIKHGLRFRFEMREVDVLVLREPEDSN